MTLNGELTRASRDWSGSFLRATCLIFIHYCHIKRPTDLLSWLNYLVLTLDLTQARGLATEWQPRCIVYRCVDACSTPDVLAA
jgi:hypothetical protein